jgi:hypothetical protein
MEIVAGIRRSIVRNGKYLAIIFEGGEIYE